MTEWSLWMKHNPHALARPGWILFEPADTTLAGMVLWIRVDDWEQMNKPADLNVAITPIAGPSA